MWLFFALLAPFFFAIVHVMDSYCVEELFRKPWIGMITSAIASLVVFVPLPYLVPFLSWSWPALHICAFALLAGVLIQMSQVLYFQSLSNSEAGIVAAYWNMIPAIILILSFIFLREILSISEYIGISVLIFAAVYFIRLDCDLHHRLKTFVFMFIACCLQACAYLLLDHVYIFIPYYQAFLFMVTGIIIAGLTPLLLPSIWREVRVNLPTLLPATKFIVGVEIVNILALATAQKAVALGNPALVAAAETTIPAFVFIISISLLMTLSKFGDAQSKTKLPQKLITVGFMCVGVLLIF